MWFQTWYRQRCVALGCWHQHRSVDCGTFWRDLTSTKIVVAVDAAARPPLLTLLRLRRHHSSSSLTAGTVPVCSLVLSSSVYSHKFICLPPTKLELNAFARVLLVCLSVSLSVSRITQKHVRGCGWNVACRQMSGHGRNWLTFEPDPDYSPDAGLLSSLSYKLSYTEFYVGKIPRVRIGAARRCSDACF